MKQRLPTLSALTLALGLSMHDTAVAQDHSGHAKPANQSYAGPTGQAKATPLAQPAAIPLTAQSADPTRHAGMSHDTNNGHDLADHAALGHGPQREAATAAANHAAPTKPLQSTDHSGMDHAATNHDAMQRHAAMGHTAKPHGKANHGAHGKLPASPPATSSHADMGRSTMDHHAMNHAAMDHTPKPEAARGESAGSPPASSNHAGMNHSTMDHSTMDHAAMGHHPSSRSEPITPIPTVTDADRAAAFPVLHQPMVHAPEINHYVAFNRLEAWDAKRGAGQSWEGQAWIGSDLNRLWLRTEGARHGGKTDSAQLEVLYGRSISTWWDVLAGLKHDFRPGGSQTWAAFGVQGLAPYKFEVSATAYIGRAGKTALSIEAEYELLLTNRLILQPLIEVNLYGKDDTPHAIGSGLSTVEAGLRLRYEIDRKFAPYVGVVHERAFGRTANFRQSHGDSQRETRVVAGLRLWF